MAIISGMGERTSRLPGTGEPVQEAEASDPNHARLQWALHRRAIQRSVVRGARVTAPDQAAAAAEAGLSRAGQSLPHREALQRSFGPEHDLAGVSAHVGGDAAAACDAISAEAYASGDKVAFSRDPDVRLAAHEAAHVIQQR